MKRYTDYRVYGERELIERIHELEAIQDQLMQTCDHCNAPLYTIVRAHSHTEDGADVTGTNIHTCDQCGKDTPNPICNECAGA